MSGLDLLPRHCETIFSALWDERHGKQNRAAVTLSMIPIYSAVGLVQALEGEGARNSYATGDRLNLHSFPQVQLDLMTMCKSANNSFLLDGNVIFLIQTFDTIDDSVSTPEC